MPPNILIWRQGLSSIAFHGAKVFQAQVCCRAYRSFSFQPRRISIFERLPSHGVAIDGSPRREPWAEGGVGQSHGAAKECRQPPFFFRPCRGLRNSQHDPHGSRRGLSSDAAPQLLRSEILQWAVSHTDTACSTKTCSADAALRGLRRRAAAPPRCRSGFSLRDS